MTNKSEHTPLPWKLKNCKIYDGLDDEIIDTEFSSDAEFVVRAVNSHYEMLNALKHVYKVFKMDEVDSSISMQVGIAISKAEGEK